MKSTSQLFARPSLLFSALLVGVLFVCTTVGMGLSAYADTSDTSTSTPATVETTDTATSTPSADEGVQTTEASTTPQVAPEVLSQAATTTAQDGTGGVASDVGGTVVTQDATASTTVDNQLNANTTNPDGPGNTNSSNITASNENEGSLVSAATSTAETGENVVMGVATSTIETGNAQSTANVINVINTNIFNSDGLILFLNQMFGGGLDLSEQDLAYFLGNSPSTGECTILSCLNSSQLNVLNMNTATVTNSVIVRAATGENSASSSAEAAIQTGDAYAAANVLNLVNTNLTNSKYLLVSFNNFGTLDGDITLPGASFFEQLLSHGAAMPELVSSSYTATNTNNATTTASTTAEAATGNNEAIAMGTSTGMIETGEAYSSASSYTQQNTNLLGGSSVFMLFRVWGNWTGTVEGLPAGIAWDQTPDGIRLVSTESSSTPPLQEGLYTSSLFNASSTNTAVLENDVHVYALTGENRATTDGVAPASVSTGDAYAAANVVNLVNTNIVGRNWIFAIFNIFGDWNGNISFGGSSPDLWIGTVVTAPNPTPAGSEVTYEFTVKNNGKTDASGVFVEGDFDPAHLSFSDGDFAALDTGGTWNIGTVPAGQSRVVTVRGRVADLTPGALVEIPMRVRVAGAQSDRNDVDNVDSVTIMAAKQETIAASSGGGGGGGGGSGTVYTPARQWMPSPAITVTKTVVMASSTLPARADYTVVVRNAKTAGPAYDGVLTDTLVDPAGKKMYSRSWNLDTVEPGDEITLTYTVEYGATSTPGTYTNTAQVTGMEHYQGQGYGTPMKPVMASSTIEFLASGKVLGAATSSVQCIVPVKNPVRIGRANSQMDVFGLQIFLNVFEKESLAFSGTYDAATIAAVRRFQEKYAVDILAPLKLQRPTGLVLGSTLRKIAALSCPGSDMRAAVAAPVQDVAADPSGTVTHATQSAPKPAKKTPVSAKKPAPAAQQTAAVSTPAPAPAAAPQKKSIFGFSLPWW